MTTYITGSKALSQPITVPRGALVTVLPETGASAVLESTAASSADIANGVALWMPWPNGTVTNISSLMAADNLFVRVIATGGVVALQVDENPSGRALEPYRSDWVTPNDLAVTATFDTKLAREKDVQRAAIIYATLPKFAPFGRQLSDGGTYFNSNYVGGNSDGSRERPFTTLEGLTFNKPGQVINIAYGSIFFVNTTRITVCAVTANNVTFRPYGDATLPLPLITGMKEVTGFTLVNGEYEATLTQAIGPNVMAIAYGDSLPSVMVNNTPGSLTTGQAGYAANKVYLKDNPGTRKVYASVTGNVIQVTANGFRMDSIHTGYTHNNTIALLPTLVGGTVNDAIFRDTACWYSGNSAISGGDVGKAATNVIIIRHQDVGAYNNGISGQGDDSSWWVIEPVCTGKLRVNGLYAGYINDAVTAHGTGIGPWVIAGGIMINCKENGIDLIGGQPGSGLEAKVHAGSLALYNRIQNCNEIGLFMWAANSSVIGNIVTDTLLDPIRIGNQDPITAAMSLGGIVQYNFTARGGSVSSSSGIGVVWGGVWVKNNTMVISSTTISAAHGNVNTNTNPGFRTDDNVYVMERGEGPILQFNSSNGLLLAKFPGKGNVYVCPALQTTGTGIGTAFTPFSTGGGRLTTAQWIAQQEMTGRAFLDNTSAGISGPLYAPSIGSPVASSQTFNAPGYDINARFAAGFAGASAPA